MKNNQKTRMTGRLMQHLVPCLMLGFFTGFVLEATAQIEHLPYQLRYNSGQTVQPIFQGWSRNDDGSFDMHFGYLNRNYVEAMQVPIGEDNFIDMAGLDQRQRQPSYFHSRSNRDIFTVTVPADFGNRELVWSLTTQDKTLQAVGWLQSEWEIDEYGGMEPDADMLANQPPKVTVTMASSVQLPAKLSLTARVTDDGLPEPEPEPTAEELQEREAAASRPNQSQPPLLTPSEGALEIPVNVPQLALGVRGDQITAQPPKDKLSVSYSVWRGPANIRTEPQFALVENGSATTSISFSKPGEYQLQVRAYDGGKSSYELVTVNVLE